MNEGLDATLDSSANTGNTAIGNEDGDLDAYLAQSATDNADPGDTGGGDEGGEQPPEGVSETAKARFHELVDARNAAEAKTLELEQRLAALEGRKVEATPAVPVRPARTGTDWTQELQGAQTQGLDDFLTDAQTPGTEAFNFADRREFDFENMAHNEAVILKERYEAHCRQNALDQRASDQDQETAFQGLRHWRENIRANTDSVYGALDEDTYQTLGVPDLDGAVSMAVQEGLSAERVKALPNTVDAMALLVMYQTRPDLLEQVAVVRKKAIQGDKPDASRARAGLSASQTPASGPVPAQPIAIKLTAEEKAICDDAGVPYERYAARKKEYANA